MSSSSTVTYTSVYTDSEPWRVFWGADEELSDGGSPRVIVYRYDGLPMQPVAPPSPDYVPGPEHPPSPDYVPGLEHPPSPVEVPYVPEPEYHEYLVPSDAEAPLEDQPLPADALPTALSPGYMANFDPEEDPEEDHADYPADGGDDDDEPSDDDDDDDEDEDPIEDGDDDEEEEEHLAPVDSSAIPVVDPVPSVGDTEAVEEVAPMTLEGVNARVIELAAFQYETARLLDWEALVSREAWAHSVGLSSAVHYELQAYRTHSQMQDYRIASSESLMTTLIAHVSSLQGQLSAALG
ncbi:hypothetical protein Tco_0422364 [Tanacetum coccineum]